MYASITFPFQAFVRERARTSVCLSADAHASARCCVCTVSTKFAVQLISHYARCGSACLRAILCVCVRAVQRARARGRVCVCVSFNDRF